MIQKQSKLKITDNTGVKLAQCIHVYNGLSATIGEIILITIKKVSGKKQKGLPKGTLSKALLVRTKYLKKTNASNYISFDENSIILLNKQNQPLGTRILGPIPLILRKKKHLKILSVASTLI
jgi:large subunit ribosomal protein L14